MLTGNFPFNNVSELLMGSYHPPEGVSTTCQELLAGFLTVSTDDRINLDVAMQHPWIVNEVEGEKFPRIFSAFSEKILMNADVHMDVPTQRRESKLTLQTMNSSILIDAANQLTL